MLKKILIFLLVTLTISAKEYKKIIILDPAVVETVYMIGGEDRIAAIAKSTMTPIKPAEKTSKLPNVGTLLKPNLEEIISYNPDMVIVGNFHNQITNNFDTFHIPYKVFKSDSLKTMLNNISVLGEMTGRKKEAQRLYNDSLKRLNQLKEKTKEHPLNLKGTILYNSTPLMAFAEGSVQNEILDSLGIDDISKGVIGQRPILSPEYMLKKNPDFLIGMMGIQSIDNLLRSNQYLLKTKAGKNKNIYILKSNRLLRMSPYIISEIEDIYKFLDKIK